MKKISTARGPAIIFLTCLALVATSAVPAATAQSLDVSTPDGAGNQVGSGLLNPDTFAGPVLVATPEGEVLTYVDAGGLPAEAAKIKEEVAEGTLVPGADLGPGAAERSGREVAAQSGGCGNWQQAVASLFGYVASTNGCAVFGYVGYIRPYSWANASDVSMCAQGKGWNSANTQVWYGLGCLDANDRGVPWGNSLAYTQVRGYSLSGVTGAAYNWYD